MGRELIGLRRRHARVVDVRPDRGRRARCAACGLPRRAAKVSGPTPAIEAAHAWRPRTGRGRTLSATGRKPVSVLRRGAEGGRAGHRVRYLAVGRRQTADEVLAERFARGDRRTGV